MTLDACAPLDTTHSDSIRVTIWLRRQFTAARQRAAHWDLPDYPKTKA